MITAEMIIDTLPLYRNSFVDPIRVKNGDFRDEWIFWQGTKFEVRVLADRVEPAQFSMIEFITLGAKATEAKMNTDRENAERKSKLLAAEAVCEATKGWTGHKQFALLNILEELNAAKRQ